MWDFLYAKDAGRAFYLLGESGIAGKTYCIGSGIARPLREYIEKIRDAVDPKASVGFGDVPYSPKQVMYLCADISELTADTGFTPEYTFEQGIRETVDWIKSGLQ
jgi:nucleoside-diphosphate-sugar epimerase